MKKTSRSLLFVVLAMIGMLLAACNGQLPAGAEVNVGADGKSVTVEFSGTVGAIGADQWTIAGQAVLVNATTTIDGTFAVGDTVKVNATVDASGVVRANTIEAPGAGNGNGAADSQNTQATPGTELQGANHNDELTGKVESIAADSWTVKGQAFAVNSQTEIIGNILLGDVVKVHFVANADGSFSATEIEKAGDNQANNSFDKGNKSDNEVDFVGAVESIAADGWTVAGKTFAVTAETEIKGNFVVGDIVKVHIFTAADGTLTAREIEKALPQDLNGLNNPEDMKIYGILEQINGDQYVISGQVVLVTPDTELDSGLVVGASVKAEVFVNTDGTMTAKEIETSNGDDKGSKIGSDDSASSDSGSNSGSGSGSSDSGSDDGNDDDHGGSGSDDSGSGHD